MIGFTAEGPRALSVQEINELGEPMLDMVDLVKRLREDRIDF